MQRVKDDRYLYRRGSAWVFRRAVPDSAQAAFGTSAVYVTLRAASLGEARLAMQPHLESFERKLRSTKQDGAAAALPAVMPDPHVDRD